MKIFYVDVPNSKTTDDDGSWINVGIFPTRKAAERFLMDRWNIPKAYSKVFIIEGID